VRIDRIVEIEANAWGDYSVVLKSGARVPMSRSQRHKIRHLASDFRPTG
jgi:hypothetical protein